MSILSRSSVINNCTLPFVLLVPFVWEHFVRNIFSRTKDEHFIFLSTNISLDKNKELKQLVFFVSSALDYYYANNSIDDV